MPTYHSRKQKHRVLVQELHDAMCQGSLFGPEGELTNEAMCLRGPFHCSHSQTKGDVHIHL